MPSIVTLTMNPCIDKSAVVSNVAPERKLRCGEPRYEPGGGGINVSRAVHKLGGESTALYLAGGPLGNMLQNLLEEEGIRHRATNIHGLTRENLMVYEESSGQQFRFGMPGPPVAEEEWRKCLETLSSLDPIPEYMVASGSLPPGVPSDFYRRVSKLAGDAGIRLIVDSSGEPFRLALKEGVFLIKPNLRELRDLSEKELEDESHQVAVAQRLVQEGQCTAVVVSLGAAGALMVSEDGCERVRAPTVSIKSKVGAGDSMVAGITLALDRGWSLGDAVRFGVASGAAAVMTPGTELCRREDAEKLYQELEA
jgi:6-phosphofructokinase 2